MGCTPGCTADLADEHEHVERAGLGQVHHEGEVHDAQASAPASSSLGDHARHPLIPPYRFSNKQILREYASTEIPLMVPPISDWLTPDETVAHIYVQPFGKERGGKRVSRGSE